MKKDRKAERALRTCWHPFDRKAYRWAWKNKKLLGILSRFCRDIRSCKQRISRGYCREDLYDIDEWFLAIVPNMLEEYRDSRDGSPAILGTNYTNEAGILVNDTCDQEWDAILDQMIFLFREADGLCCQKKNPYEEEYEEVLREFKAKYGPFGEKLRTEEERAAELQTKLYVAHFPSELPEYKDIEKKYLDAERELEEYREQCKDKAFVLFSKWFFYLWD